MDIRINYPRTVSIKIILNHWNEEWNNESLFPSMYQDGVESGSSILRT